ncbi:hypothetical protein E1B28_006571 [Marasmius oreades]|uniref:Uncharacterized protein n=1 Tax=Marasmius oreades TaxID=181124 RepID=A0A9P7UVE9_9AGAR|nr:uncharacterized protein E1B28_006571 [Marasmius oreades]KAG7095882.1 hypothetical protein E1B28_006571 [Marasmius oreades]
MLPHASSFSLLLVTNKVLISLNRAVSIIPIGFNNPDFIKAFARSFVSFAISLDPGYKLNSSIITPLWDLYRPGNTEMVFNKTVDDSPDVHAVRTDGRLLDWCRFWESIGSITGQ